LDKDVVLNSLRLFASSNFELEPDLEGYESGDGLKLHVEFILPCKSLSQVWFLRDYRAVG
jgi:hypothetical protein